MEPEDGRDDDQPEFRSPLPPDDRLWRHPSELPPSRERPAARRRLWQSSLPTVALSASVGALLTVGVAVVLGPMGLDLDRVGERSLSAEGAQTTAMATGEQVVDMAQKARSAVVELRSPHGDKAVRGVGVVFRPDGYVLTSASAVEGTRSLIVVPGGGGGEKSANVVGVDRDSDVGVIKLTEGALPAARLGSAVDLAPGSLAIAVDGTRNRVGAWWATVCMVNDVHHRLDLPGGRVLLDMIRTDAPVNRQAAGGALLDSSGAVIGIRTASGTGDAASRGWGFATPIDVARNVAEQLVDRGKVTWPWLGVEGADLEPAAAAQLRVGGGAVVQKVVEGGPAQRSGMAARDVIVAVDGKEIRDMEALAMRLRVHRPGAVAVFDVLRGGTRSSMRVTLDERPEVRIS